MAPAPFTEKSILSALKCIGTFVVNQMTICVWGYVCTLFSSISVFLKIFPQTLHAIQIYWQSLLIEKSWQHSLGEQSFAIWSLHNTIQTSYHGILILVSGNLRPHSLCRGHSGLLSRVALGSHIRDLIRTLPGSPYGSHICHVHSCLLITHQLNATSSARPSSLN